MTSSTQEIMKVIKALMQAADSLMDEVTGQRATKWGIVNDAMVKARALLAKVEGKE